jgi:RTX calcium-binding nonapeptide repeat (4 copies)
MDIYGTEYAETLYGTDEADNIIGFGGDDYLDGGYGNDRLDGYATSGTEYDTLIGGAGSDTFVLGGFWGVSYQGTGYATIADWDPSADYIETPGDSSQYSFGYSDWSGGSAMDTQIYYGSDLIAVVQDSTDVDFVRDFQFV